MTKTNQTISNIASQVGFGNTNTLTRTFRVLTGLSLLEYRRQHMDSGFAERKHDWFFSFSRFVDRKLGTVKYANSFALDVGSNVAGKFCDANDKMLREAGQMIRDANRSGIPFFRFVLRRE